MDYYSFFVEEGDEVRWERLDEQTLKVCDWGYGIYLGCHNGYIYIVYNTDIVLKNGEVLILIPQNLVICKRIKVAEWRR